MLAMHYAIPLSSPHTPDSIRQRARERGPMFDGMPGLKDKLFLLDTIDPCYATFYLWRTPEAAQAFLEGDFFKALSQAFGRPEVHLWLTAAEGLPAGAWDRAVLSMSGGPEPKADSVKVIEPLTGKYRWLAQTPAAGRQFDVMYHAHG
ncbi:MAG TPA: DUF4865 family protein [Magnetospirillaceae bacterium]